MSTMKFAALVLAHDALAQAEIACHLDVSANDDDWQSELDNDPDYLTWIEAQAEAENMRHARW
jgi:hypothetical protein